MGLVVGVVSTGFAAWVNSWAWDSRYHISGRIYCLDPVVLLLFFLAGCTHSFGIFWSYRM